MITRPDLNAARSTPTGNVRPICSLYSMCAASSGKSPLVCRPYAVFRTALVASGDGEGVGTPDAIGEIKAEAAGLAEAAGIGVAVGPDGGD